MTKLKAVIIICLISFGLIACQHMQVRPTATVSVGAGL